MDFSDFLASPPSSFFLYAWYTLSVCVTTEISLYSLATKHRDKCLKTITNKTSFVYHCSDRRVYMKERGIERGSKRERKNTSLRYISSTIFPSEARIAASSSLNAYICTNDQKKEKLSSLRYLI